MRKAEGSADRVVIEAEAIVQQAWVAQLRERYDEAQVSLSTVLARQAHSEQNLARAQESGDRRQVAVEEARLAEARRIAAKLGQVVGRFRQVLAIEESQLVNGGGPISEDRDDAE